MTQLARDRSRHGRRPRRPGGAWWGWCALAAGLAVLAISGGPARAGGEQAPAAAAAPAALPAGWEGAEAVSFPKLNRSYRDLVSDFEPVRQGGLTLTLSSPSQVVVLKSHRALLRRRADGAFDARVEIELFGKGFVAGDLDYAGRGTRLQDELLIPPQTLVLDGRLMVEKAAELSAYRITTLEMPVEVVATIESGIVREMVTWCDRLSLVPLTRLDCPSFERSMSRIRVPMPPAGESYLLPWNELEEADRARLDAILGLPAGGAAGAPAPGAGA